jgi:two-component system chemotaxis response regulator CheB
MVQYDCLIGHRWSTASLEAFQRTEVEASLWAAMRALEEQAVLNRRLADRSARDRRARATASFADAARVARQQAEVLRAVVKAITDIEPVPETERS